MPRTRAYLALGGNVGDVPATFAAALARLDGPGATVVAASRVYATPPMGAAAGGAFHNAAAAVDTSLTAEELLDRLQAIETEFGRVRSRHWGPRPLDLDVVFFGDAVLDTPRLVVPHPACWLRRFVLDPLADIAAEVRHPLTGETVADLRARLLPRPLPVRIDGPDELAATLADALSRDFPAVRFAAANPALTLRVGSDEVSAVRREVGLGRSTDMTALLDAVRAALTAVAGEPVPTGPLPG